MAVSLRPTLGNWGGFLTLMLIVATIVLLVFSTVLRTVFIGIILLSVIAIILYYAGIRLDNRLRHGRQTKVVEKETTPDMPQGNHWGDEGGDE